MKKVLILSLIAVSMSCGGKKETTAPAEEFSTPDNTPKVAVDDQIAQGEALVKGSDCKTCHHAVNKIIGPSHTDVAKKYEFTEANVKLLADKILKGGQGVWGQIPMTAHVDITQVDAEKMARYVLSLDGEKEH
jgi:cytochrome c